jgi:hypothetical protein
MSPDRTPPRRDVRCFFRLTRQGASHGIRAVSVVVLLSLCALRASAIGIGIGTELVVNGNFESGTLAGWTMSGTGSDSGWFINDGTYDPSSVNGPSAPLSGFYDAVGDQAGPSLSLLSAPILLPGVVTSASFSWLDRIENGYRLFDASQRFSVAILDAQNISHMIFTTMPGDPLTQWGPNARSFDVTGLLQTLAGTTVKLQFENQAAYFYNTVHIDDVSLVVNARTVPESGATGWSLAGALGLLGLLRRQKKQSPQGGSKQEA